MLTLLRVGVTGFVSMEKGICCLCCEEEEGEEGRLLSVITLLNLLMKFLMENDNKIFLSIFLLKYNDVLYYG
jgi:hypothetical protein